MTTGDAPLGIVASALGRRWRWRAAPLPLGAAQRLGVDDLAARLLLSRGCAADDVSRTLSPALRDWLPDPSIFADMDRAANRLADAVAAGETIVVFADYDVDGATSAAFLLRHLAALGATARPYIPDRLLEGYGPSAEALLRFRAEGTGLVVLLDCGTQAFAPLAAARDSGLDVIVVDHHKASTELPPSLALVNPNRLDETEEAAGFGHLCTAGLAFLVGVALNRTLRQRGFFANRPEPRIADWLDIVALGTVADVVPLTGLNRALVSLGLKRMARRDCAGIAALCDIAAIGRAPRADDLGFHLGPRINAGGRVGKADLGVRLLLASDLDDARPLAIELDQLNQQRRTIETAVLAEAMARAHASATAGVVVVAGEGWHPGVVGIVAARLKERLHRPALVLAIDDQGLAKGSGRSIPGVDLGAAILAAKAHGLIREGGGHAMAVGVTVEESAIPALADWLSSHLAASVTAAASERCLDIDLSVTPQGLTVDLAQALDVAGPYGQGWPSPRVAVGPVRLLKVDTVGRTEPRTHLRFIANGRDGGRVTGIAFGAVDTPLGQLLAGAIGQDLCLAGRISINQWQGQSRVDLQLDDAALAG